MHVVSVVGARPRFIKAAALGRELRREYGDTLMMPLGRAIEVYALTPRRS